MFFNVSSSCDSPEKLKAILPRLEQELKDTGKFKDFYQFTFNFAKNPGQKGLGEPDKKKNVATRNLITNLFFPVSPNIPEYFGVY